LITDQDLVVRLKAIIVVTWSEETIVAKEFGMVEQASLHLRSIGGSSEKGMRPQQRGDAN
jgi:hypothetical protein